jgi:hypothetical protein
MDGPSLGKLYREGSILEQFEQYYRLPQDVVGHDAALLSYWDTMPAKAQLRLLESEVTVSTLGELKMLAERFSQENP